MQNSKGFTIIELLVVIAIIAVLAAIVLVNVTSFINKSKNAAIKGNMSNMIVRAAAYFEANPANFGAAFIASSGYTVPEAAVLSANGGTNPTEFGAAATQAWCSCSPIYNITSESGTFCVDSTGYKKVTLTGGNACVARCTAASGALPPACID